jgi:ABC-type nitrate/sulfonate/bicarbonate transport system substrate-binding protein
MRSHRPVRSENPMSARRTLLAAAVAAAAALLPQMASAQDSLKLAVGQRGNWASSVAEVGQRAGIFKKHGLTLDLLYTQGSGETQQAVIAESVDVGVAAGTMGAMSAFAKGAPVRIIAAETTGASDLYWYVKADSPIKTIKDFDGRTVAYSTNGSSTHMVVMAFIKQFGLKAKAVSTGGPIPTLTQVMSGQIDVGWSAPPDGLDQLDRGEIRYIANGNDAEIFKGQTVRVNITNARTLATRGDAMKRFAQAYRETARALYADDAMLDLCRLARDLDRQGEAHPRRLLSLGGAQSRHHHRARGDRRRRHELEVPDGAIDQAPARRAGEASSAVRAVIPGRREASLCTKLGYSRLWH